MIDIAAVWSLHWTTLVAIFAICLALDKVLRQVLLASGPHCPLPGVAKHSSVSEQDYPDLQIPKEPHLEIALDPPNGLQVSNPREPYTFENDLCRGSYIFFHTPTHQSEVRGSGGLSYRDYFKGKRRLWELRVQFQFKEPPEPGAEIFFGTELAAYVPLSKASKSALGMAVGTVRKAIGGVYHSPGDDPAHATGELERPTCVFPLWSFDQFIETPEGEEPPRLTDPRFPELGQKRFKRMGEYAQEIEALRNNFKVGASYTFASWGISQFLDVLNWRLCGIPMITPLDFNRFVGGPPVYEVLYTLKPYVDGEGDGRHVQSRKNYYFRAAIWNSSRRPERSRFEALTGAKQSGVSPAGPAFKQIHARDLRSRIDWMIKRSLSCCINRPEHV